MMSRIQITLDEKLKRASQRAGELGMTLTEYVRSLIKLDPPKPYPKGDVRNTFDLGSSKGSDVAKNKDSMVADALYSMLE